MPDRVMKHSITWKAVERFFILTLLISALIIPVHPATQIRYWSAHGCNLKSLIFWVVKSTSIYSNSPRASRVRAPPHHCWCPSTSVSADWVRRETSGIQPPSFVSRLFVLPDARSCVHFPTCVWDILPCSDHSALRQFAFYASQLLPAFAFPDPLLRLCFARIAASFPASLAMLHRESWVNLPA